MRQGLALPMKGCSGPSCGGSCRPRRRCRPVLAAATDGGASSRWAGIVCQWSAPASINSSNSICSTAVVRDLAEEVGAAAEPSSTRRGRSRLRTRRCFITPVTAASKTMNSRRSLSSPCRASNPARSLTAQPDRRWPTDPESFQVR